MTVSVLGAELPLKKNASANVVAVQSADKADHTQALEQVRALMLDALQGVMEGPANNASQYQISTRGSFLRARLALASCRSFECSQEYAVVAAACCELIHNASLVHDDLLDGDLDLVRVADQAELLRYCYGVVGTVGVMMTCLLNAREREKALPHAIDLGIAMQLTNISRDVLEDAHLNRLYLPADGAGGTITPEDIVAGNRDARHQAWLGVRNLLGMSEAYYRSGWHGLGYLPFRARLAIAVAAKVYRQIGRQILQRGEQRYWQSRCVVGSAEKLRVSVAAVVQLAAGAINRQSIRHDHELHQGLITSLKLRQPEKR